MIVYLYYAAGANAISNFEPGCQDVSAIRHFSDIKFSRLNVYQLYHYFTSELSFYGPVCKIKACTIHNVIFYFFLIKYQINYMFLALLSRLKNSKMMKEIYFLIYKMFQPFSFLPLLLFALFKSTYIGVHTNAGKTCVVWPDLVSDTSK